MWHEHAIPPPNPNPNPNPNPSGVAQQWKWRPCFASICCITDDVCANGNDEVFVLLLKSRLGSQTKNDTKPNTKPTTLFVVVSSQRKKVQSSGPFDSVPISVPIPFSNLQHIQKDPYDTIILWGAFFSLFFFSFSFFLFFFFFFWGGGEAES